ncbi:MAG: FtsW/RodA/SpoVE family cell cycle protein [Clostridia bacterium]|nr:FtsW/RodA/SpoVE family cell cycle protein [Clostridia bacterium]
MLKRNRLSEHIRETDWVLLILCAVTSAFGVLMVHSATIVDIEGNAHISRDTRTMVLAVIMGLAIAAAVSFIDFNFITKLFPVIGAVCVLLMLVLFIPGVGVGPAERQDVKTWISIPGSGLYFQPSELVKIGFVITLGMHLDIVRDRLREIKQLLFLCIHGMVPVGLVILSGDLGSALVFMAIFISMMFCAGVQLRYFVIGAAAVCAAAPGVWYFLFSNTQKERFLGLIYPDLYKDIMYQQNYGLEAIRHGGLLGQGLFKGSYTQAGLVPESENDMIFTCIGEELGLVGCVVCLLLLLSIAFRIIQIGSRQFVGSTELMCYGMATMIAFQVLVNVGVCLKILPVIGITLPFFSAGGSSTLCVYIGIGLILSFYRANKEKEIINLRFTEFD